MRKVGSMSARLMRSQTLNNQEATPEVTTTTTAETKSSSSSSSSSPPLSTTTTTPTPGGLLGRASSWRVKSGTFSSKSVLAGAPRRPSKHDVQSLCSSLANVRESKLAYLLDEDEENSLQQIEFDNKGLSMDEIHVAAVLLLERAAPQRCFADKAGLAVLFDFVHSVRQVYRANPYHDFRHAVDVAQFTNFMFSRPDVASQLQASSTTAGSLEVTKFTALVACLCHDAGHDGLTNALHRKQEGDSLVARFGQESPLERLHADHCERLVSASALLQVANLDPAVFLATCRQLILGTDMEKHAGLVASFKANPTSTYLLQMIIKVADISNVTRDFEEARVWSRRLDAEMKAHPGAPASPAVSLAQSVTGFAKMFALPLAAALQEGCLPETGRLLQRRIESNNDMWFRVDAGEANPGL